MPPPFLLKNKTNVDHSKHRHKKNTGILIYMLLLLFLRFILGHFAFIGREREIVRVLTEVVTCGKESRAVREPGTPHQSFFMEQHVQAPRPLRYSRGLHVTVFV